MAVSGLRAAAPFATAIVWDKFRQSITFSKGLVVYTDAYSSSRSPLPHMEMLK